MRLTNIIRYFLLFCLTLLTQNAMAEYAAGACSLIPNSKTCVDTTPCKTDSSGSMVCLAGINPPSGGVNVTQTCWQYSYQYACASNSINTCTAYQTNPSCAVINSICVDTIAESGQCDEWQYTYQCQTKAAVTEQQLVCGDSMLNSITMPTPTNPNNTFPQAAVAQELLNEGGTYNNNGVLFGGVQETCTKGYAGLKNCCKSAPGAKSNSAVANIALGAGASVVKYAGAEAIDWASPYVFDAMYSNGIFQDALIGSFSNFGGTDAAVNLGTSLSSGGLTLGAYGFTFSASGAAMTGGGLMGADISMFNGYLSFNPYAFAAAVAVQVIMELISCDQKEQLLSMHKGAGLSTYISEECTGDILGMCYEYTDTYCSFNSVLAEIINIQGKSQLGLDIASCQGITPDMLSKIDFSKINFGAFTQSLLQNAQNHAPTSSSISNGYSPVMQNATKGSSQQSNSPTLPTYQ